MNFLKLFVITVVFDLSKNRESIYEIDDCRLPIQSVAELAEIDSKINSNPGMRATMIQVMQDMYVSSDRNNTNFLAKLLKKEVIEDTTWSKLGGKRPHRLMDYTLFNSIFPRKCFYCNSTSAPFENLVKLRKTCNLDHRIAVS